MAEDARASPAGGPTGGGARGAALEARGLAKRFGGVEALSDYNLVLAPGQLLGLIGPNGAGKTTVFNLLTGVIQPTEGGIWIDGKPLAGKPAQAFAAAGIARTFQNIRLFAAMSVLENVMVPLHRSHGADLVSTLLALPAFRRREREIAERAMAMLELLGLDRMAEQRAADLAYGDQRRVEIARALAGTPSVLLLDEPSAGMNPNETAEIVELISRVHRDFGISMVVVEHDMKLIMRLSQELQVLNRGRVLAAGSPAEVQADPEVIAAYLGTRRKDRADA